MIGRGKRSGFTQRLRRRFIVGAMAAVTLVLAAIIAAINVASYLSVCQQADGRLAYIASCEGLVPYASGEKPGKDRERELKSDLAKYGLSVEMMFELRYFTVVVNADGSMGEAYTDRIATVDEDEARQLVQTLAQQGRTSGFSDAYRFCVVDAPSTSGDDGGRMYILLDCGRDLSKFWGTFAMSLVVGVAGLLLVLLLVIMFSHIVLKPVVESYEKQRRFVTDASHEIKTPLAVIDAANEVLKIEHGEDEWTDSIHEQVERLSGLCEQLVMLSRMDEGGSRLNVRQVDIAEVVREAAAPFETLAGARGKRLEVHTPGHLDYRADPEAVARALGLLLDNATRYASEGSTIELVAEGGVRGVVLSVSNPVDEAPEGDLNRLFERFYRPDSSRSSSTGGSGIGLSIVRAIAEAHGGRASVSYNKGILTFSMRL